MIELREVQHGSPDYEACVGLRREVLRRPLGLEFTDEQLSAERNDVHLGAFEGERCVGCLVLTRIDDETVQMRQVGVSPQLQRSGIGTGMVAWSEDKAMQLGYRRMLLHARDTAVPFYLRLGYAIVGEPFTEVTILHREMVKELGDSGRKSPP